MDHYSGAACAGSPVFSMSFNCREEDGPKWTSLMCDADVTGYAELQYTQHSSNDCSGDPTLSLGIARKYWSCQVGAEMQNDLESQG